MLIKSIIFPQFLFLFQTLPIYISPKTLAKRQQLLINFVWAKSAHRVNQLILSRPTEMGSLGLPHLHSYYMAAQLRVIFAYY